ncbi:hypothetical protein A2631_00590 [Candidatus Daviesbacteria bacterium RIFCSPHIGHO2_01_FULL_44_29]|uniref:Uncharacterized protein n=1 Tax=Candidatus Daviesbacteria bacterium RIFCSPHIGHO2_02_FULL_43_12 TaxID=1797776 RepID=A0A1F5KHB7_9BACT|nr:MAG: hypothetical protein A2631_00590 [Candidatus Daviesbacteria bacterium RIFCSPHIGHO2_01_FULL_44_29]OGE39438.1 MAG: hypothetical protein A3E86_01470 [Candidatus Daviesbacteria bacterium RIFCSPHIGHO2_12_FULL_47_45]OGE40337.1 MAG: hypothetical protein A3D25_03070 [Candidatus Daviesbacteria bacterium RIFCSPHIGHO2_02_FULL_43_12]OGE69744.1 MAG: hypothetical protein A3B55_02135 [Candidatus Daviesbacteria bacterium RIFCSPLOWO2_01_FULL_43_15]
MGDETVHDVLDGAHRATAVNMLMEEGAGDGTLMANVFHGIGDRELFQERALAINSVASLKLPRIGIWCTNAWQQSPWANRGLKLHQVFELAAQSRPRLTQTGLNKDEGVALITWGRETASDIQEKPGMLAQIFRTVDYAAPDLVRNARTPDPGTDARSVITPYRLEAVVGSFRDLEFYAAQRGVMRVITEGGLRARETQALVQAAARVLRPGMQEDEVYNMVRGLNLGMIRAPRRARVPRTETSPANAHNAGLQAELAQTRNTLAQSQQRVESLQAEVGRLERGIEAQVAAAEARFTLGLARERGQRTAAENSVTRLAAQIAEFEKLLAAVITRQGDAGKDTKTQSTNGHTSKESPTNGTIKPPWWHDDIFRGERRVLDALFKEGIGVDATSQQLGLPVGRVGDFISAALIKQSRLMRRTA